jgi:hypothetical protein
MKTWWIGAALAAMCVSQSAWAQSPPPAGGPLPDPCPVAGCVSQCSPFVPGPLPSASAPGGPSDALSLPAGLPTAWGPPPIPESGPFLSVGSLALMRQQPGRASIATNALVVAGPIAAPSTVTQESNGLLTNLPRFEGRAMLTTHDLDPDYSWGVRVTGGYMFDDAAIEATGFYLPEHTTSASASLPGGLAMAFFNAPQSPVGPFAFVGPNNIGVWTPADHAVISLRTQLGDAELNYRWWSKIFGGIEGIIGFRYFEYDERASIYADDVFSGAAVVNPVTGEILNPFTRRPIANALPASLLQATYVARANNHMLMPQVGFEWNQPLCCWMLLGMTAKAAFGADDLEVNTRLTSGTGFVSAQGHASGVNYTSLYELNFYADIICLDRVRLRAGYTAMWLLHVGEAFQQIDYNLAAQPGTLRDSGSVFFHGPMIELQFLF